MKTVFLQRLNGLSSYLVLFGELYGRQVLVRHLNAAFYETQWAEGREFAHMTREQFEKNVLQEIGIVHCAGEPVPEDVVAAIWEELQPDRAHRPDCYVTGLTTGRQTQLDGWIRISHRAGDGALMNDTVPAKELLPIIPESLAARVGQQLA